jgi:hypothetical protein
VTSGETGDAALRNDFNVGKFGYNRNTSARHGDRARERKPVGACRRRREVPPTIERVDLYGAAAAYCRPVDIAERLR